MTGEHTIKQAVVVGGAGFIGSHLAAGLRDAGWSVSVIDDLSEGKRERVPQGVPLYVVDVRDTQALIPLIPQGSIVFHLAAQPRVQYSIEHPQETHDVNVNGALSLLCAARSAGAARVVFSSSAAVYGDNDAPLLSEDLLPQPKSPYGLHKYIGEMYCRMFSEMYGLSTVSLRYFNVYGPGANTEGAYALVVAKFLKQRQEGVPLTITGDGEQTRDFVHVQDIIMANIAASESPKVGRGEVINIGGGKATSVREIAALVGGPVEFIPARHEPRHSQADIKLAQELLAWTPTISLKEGIAALLGVAGLL